MTLIHQSFLDLLAAFRSPAPTPGGGSAAALAGAVGTSLLAMIGSMSKHRAASDADVNRLVAAAHHCTALSDRLAALIDEDAAAYEQVVAAYKLPRESAADKAERAARIQQALKVAITVPLEVMQHCAEAIDRAAVVAAFGNPNATSDVAVALELLLAGGRGALLNVDINLGTLKDAEYANTVRGQVRALEEQSARGAAAARTHLGHQ
jgi:methenyltetrahydrofolate cyclohydrolase